jgi:peptidoglycan/LPS O-acetylase OafA/YrhL
MKRRKRTRLVAAMLVMLTPLLEKNVIKTAGVDVPLVFSMSRVIVLAFAFGMLHHIWRAPGLGWPEATLAISVVLALPLLNAVERAAPSKLLALASKLIGRFGIGSVLPVSEGEPSKYDDHRADS